MISVSGNPSLIEGVDYTAHAAFQGDTNEEMVWFAMDMNGNVYNRIERAPRNLEFLLSVLGNVPLAGFLGEIDNSVAGHPLRVWDMGDENNSSVLVQYDEFKWRLWPVQTATIEEAMHLYAAFASRIQAALKKSEEEQLYRRKESEKREADYRLVIDEQEKSALNWLAADSNRLEFVSFLRSMVVPSWVPHTVRGKKKTEAFPQESRYGGMPWMPEGEEWPQWEGEPMSFVMQLDIAFLPAAAQETVGLSEGLLQFFHGAGYDEEYRNEHIRVVDLKISGNLMKSPAIDDDRTPVHRSIGSWREAPSFPSWCCYEDIIRNAGFPEEACFLLEYDMDEEILTDLMREAGIPYDAEKGICPVPSRGSPDHLMGYPHWQQDEGNPEGDDWIFLLEVRDGGPIGDLFTGDGSGYLFVRRTENGPEFRMTWQCS